MSALGFFIIRHVSKTVITLVIRTTTLEDPHGAAWSDHGAERRAINTHLPACK